MCYLSLHYFSSFVIFTPHYLSLHHRKTITAKTKREKKMRIMYHEIFIVALCALLVDMCMCQATTVCNSQYNTYANRTIDSPCNFRDSTKYLCQKGTYCQASSNKCFGVGYVSPGIVCTEREAVDCKDDAECINGKCVASVGAGESCAESASLCRKGTVCSLSKCVAMGSLKRGEQCSATSACAMGLYCKLGSGAFPTCEPRLLNGETCSLDKECSAYSYCSSVSMTCALRKAVGQPCTLTTPSQYAAYSGQSSMCSTLLCDSGLCTSLQSKTQGQPCTTELACAQGLACVNGACTQRRLGDLCQPSAPSACPLGSVCVCDGSAFRCRVNASSCQNENIVYLMALSDKDMFGDPSPLLRELLCCNAKYSPDLYDGRFWTSKCKNIPPGPQPVLSQFSAAPIFSDVRHLILCIVTSSLLLLLILQ